MIHQSSRVLTLFFFFNGCSTRVRGCVLCCCRRAALFLVRRNSKLFFFLHRATDRPISIVALDDARVSQKVPRRWLRCGTWSLFERARQCCETKDQPFDWARPSEFFYFYLFRLAHTIYLFVFFVVPLSSIETFLRKDACPANSPFKMVPKLISSCPELMISPDITDLFRKSDAIKCVHSLTGAPVNRIWAGVFLRFFS